EGSLSGLVGSNLVLQNNSTVLAPLSGPMANGTDVVFAIANFNSSYNVTVATQPTFPSQTCIVANGTGTAPAHSNVMNIAVTCATNPPRFVFVTNGDSDTVSAYTVDPATGLLAAVPGSPFATGNGPVAVAIDGTGSYAYVVNQEDATISAYAIDRTSGALTAFSGSPYPTGPSPTGVAVVVYPADALGPAASFLFVTNGSSGTVSSYSIGANGQLTAAPGSPFATGTLPSSVTVD